MISPARSTARLIMRWLTSPRIPNSFLTSGDSSHLPHPSTEKFSVSRYEMMAHTNGKSGCPLFLESLKTRSNPNFPRYSLMQAIVPIGNDLFLFDSRTNVLSRKCFVVTNEQIHSGHFYFASSHPMSIDHLHQVLSSSGYK